jgi:serine/threonine protein kinase
MALAGGFHVGDRVLCGSLEGVVQGRPSRAACNAISVAVRYVNGLVADERVAKLELLDAPPIDGKIEQPVPAAPQKVKEEASPPQKEAKPPGRALLATAPRGALFAPAARPAAGPAAPEASPAIKQDPREVRFKAEPSFEKPTPLAGQSPEPSPAQQGKIPPLPLESALAKGKGAFFPKTCEMRNKLGMDRDLVDKMRPYAHPGGWKQLLPETIPIFESLCSRSPNQKTWDLKLDFLTYPQAQSFFKEVGQQFFGQDLSNMLDADKFERFDFDGSEGLSHAEAFRCLRLCLREKFDACGLLPHDDGVPMRTPQQAGIQKIRELARGGQGVAWLANSSKYGQVALKVYSKQNPNAGTIHDLIHELEVAKEMDLSPYIMHSYEIFQDGQNLYAINELLPGGELTSLRDKATRAGVWSEDYFRDVFKQCLKGLSHIHLRSIMHCDLKEANIMLRSTDIAKPHIAIIDLGMANAAAGPGLAGGTPGYRPPETNANNLWYPKGDIFSLGVTFFQILANRCPDERTGQMGIFQEGARSLEDVVRFTANRPVPMKQISQYPGTHSWLPQMMDKQRKKRLVSVQMLLLPWFRVGEEDELEEDDVLQEEDAQSRFTDTLGITMFSPEKLFAGEPEYEAPAEVLGEIPEESEVLPESLPVEDPPPPPQRDRKHAAPLRVEPAAAAKRPTQRDRPQAPQLRAENAAAPVPPKNRPPQLPQDDPRIIESVKSAIKSLKAKAEMRYRNTRQAFLAFDTDRKGALNPDQFFKGLKAHGIDLSPEALDSIWSVFDADHKGTITWSKFLAVIGE